MILVIGGIKGGSGKTTLATNLTVMRAYEHRKVLLVDADEQKSSWDWATQREEKNLLFTTIQLSGKGIYSQLEKLIGDYDDIIVDVGGRDTTSQRSALAIADKFLIPFKPRSLDIWTIGAVKSMILEIQAINQKLETIAVINQADPKGSDNDEALEILSEYPEWKCCPYMITQRKVFGNAAAEGKAICELVGIDKKAFNEMKRLHEYIYNKHIQHI